MAIVYQKSKGLTDAELHYCPGCTHGLVHKLVTDEGACWQYCDCHAHRDCILLKCEVCGAIQHMDCAHLGELYQHVLQRHHFRINPRRTLFYGLCDRCSGEESS